MKLFAYVPIYKWQNWVTHSAQTLSETQTKCLALDNHPISTRYYVVAVTGILMVMPCFSVALPLLPGPALSSLCVLVSLPPAVLPCPSEQAPLSPGF